MKKRLFPRPLVSLALVPAVLLSFGSSLAQAASPKFAWLQEAEQVALKADTSIVWQLNYGKQNQTKPFFHPVAVAGGPGLTEARPADHLWHYGLWFSWKFINGSNYWEFDPKTGNLEGVTEWSDTRVELQKDFSAKIFMSLAYHPTGGAEVMTERRVIDISAPAADGSYFMDWHMVFKAGTADVVLNRTPLPGEPDGKAWGGYAGLSVRFAKEFQEAQAVGADGPIQFTNTFRGKSLAMDYAGMVNGKPYGMAIIDHPANINHPTPWYVIRTKSMTFYSPAVINDGPYTLKARQELVLRYRLVVHPDRWSVGQLNQAMKQFLKP